MPCDAPYEGFITGGSLLAAPLNEAKFVLNTILQVQRGPDGPKRFKGISRGYQRYFLGISLVYLWYILGIGYILGISWVYNW